MFSFVNQPPILLDKKAPFPKISMDLLSKEPCLFSNSEEGVKIQGGMLAKIALEHIQGCYIQDIYNAKQAGLSAVIDVRVQRLMPGMFPSIPGWHCDGVPRDTYHTQPNFKAINPKAFHVVFTLSNEIAGVSNTEYVMDSVHPEIWDITHVYKDLHNWIEHFKPNTQLIQDGQFVKLFPKTIHRASPTKRRGWRMFMRYSMYHKPPIMNGLQGQQQVYILSENNGW